MVCYVPYFSSLFAILIIGLNNFTPFALHFSAIAIHFNSSLNPVLYCSRIEELKEPTLPYPWLTGWSPSTLDGRTTHSLLCSLALMDLVVGLVVLPLITAYYLTIILEMPSYYCAIAVAYGRISTFIGSASVATIPTVAIDRHLAFHLRLRYREVVKFRRVVYVFELIFAALWSGSWFGTAKDKRVTGAAILMFSCCLITSRCYISVYPCLRDHVAQIRPN